MAHPFCKLLQKECTFYFDETCLEVFGELKRKLVSTTIIISPDWIDTFEVMCDTSGLHLVWYWDREGIQSFTPFTMRVRPK